MKLDPLMIIVKPLPRSSMKLDPLMSHNEATSIYETRSLDEL